MVGKQPNNHHHKLWTKQPASEDVEALLVRDNTECYVQMAEHSIWYTFLWLRFEHVSDCRGASCSSMSLHNSLRWDQMKRLYPTRTECAVRRLLVCSLLECRLTFEMAIISCPLHPCSSQVPVTQESLAAHARPGFEPGLAKVCDGVARMSPVLLTASGSTKGTTAEVLSHNFALTNGSVATLLAPPEGIPAERHERTVVDQTSWHSLP